MGSVGLASPGVVDYLLDQESHAPGLSRPGEAAPTPGKTTTAAEVILSLVGQGKRVGITSNSHKAIFNLMRKCAQMNKGRSVDNCAPLGHSTCARLV